MNETIILKNEEDTAALGARIAEELTPNSVIALIGDLGIGKTALTKSVARGLGINGPITSPTFTIVQEYDEGRLALYHFDVYRVNDEDELFEIGFEEYLHRGGVCLIEWADLIEDMLPPETVFIRLEYGENETERICRIECGE